MAQYDFTDYGVGYDTDEEERKRRQQQAIADRMEMEAYSNPMAPIDPQSMSFGDIAGAYVNNQMNKFQNKVDTAGQMLSDPQAAFQQQVENEKRRMMQAQQQAQQQEIQQKQQEQIANQEVQSTTVKTYGDGSQEEVVKKQIPAQTVPTQQEQGQQAQQFQQQMQQFRPVAPSQLETRTPVPQNLPAQGSISANQPLPNIGQPPTPGPAINVASATPVLPTSQAPAPKAIVPVVAAVPTMAQMGQTAQATEPAWVKKANDAGSDFYKMIQVATEHPESRDFIQNKAKQLFKQQSLKDEYEQLAKAAGEGDLKAQNKLFQLIKPDTGKPKAEIGLGDYAKAYMFSRMGLPHLAKVYEDKISGNNTRFGQVTVNGTTWQVETDAVTGETLRARDNEGNYAAKPILDQIGAGGTKFGAQATQFTGGLHTVPNAKGDGQDLVMPTQNSIDPTKSGFIYMSGPNKGQPYNGTATPQPQSISTQYSKGINQAFIDFNAKPTTAAATEALKMAAVLGGTAYIDTMNAIRARSPEIFNQITSGQAGTPPTPQGVGGAAGSAQGQTTTQTGNKPAAATGNRPAGGTAGGGSLLAQTEGTKANIKTQQELDVARQKPPAETKGKIEATDITNQRTADENYGMIRDVAGLIKQSTGSGIGTRVDKLAGFFGAGTKGAAAIEQLNVLSYPFQYSIPRFEGPQGEKDVDLYVKAAGDFANPEKPISSRLAALQGMVYMMKKYDKQKNNDWTFEGAGPTSNATPGTTSSGNKYKKVQ